MRRNKKRSKTTEALTQKAMQTHFHDALLALLTVDPEMKIGRFHPEIKAALNHGDSEYVYKDGSPSAMLMNRALAERDFWRELCLTGEPRPAVDLADAYFDCCEILSVPAGTTLQDAIKALLVKCSGKKGA